MDTSELMLGDYVRLNDKFHIFNRKDFEKLERGARREDEYKPYAMTKRWCRRLGAIQHGATQRYLFPCTYFRRVDKFLEISGEYVYIRAVEADEDLKTENIEDRISGRNHLFCLYNEDVQGKLTVHKFQQLYRAVSGKRLGLDTIKDADYI